MVSKKTQKPLKLDKLKKDYDVMQVMSTYEINDVEIVKYYKRFDKQKIDEMILEMYEDIKYVVDNNIDFFTNDEHVIKYQLFMIVKHFSHFKDEIGKKFEDKIEAMAILMSTGLFDLFFEEIFDAEEVFEALDRVDKTTELANIKIAELEKLELQKQKVQNKEIFINKNKEKLETDENLN